jgi:hypothetical protein
MIVGVRNPDRPDWNRPMTSDVDGTTDRLLAQHIDDLLQHFYATDFDAKVLDLPDRRNGVTLLRCSRSGLNNLTVCCGLATTATAQGLALDEVEERAGWRGWRGFVCTI